MPISRSHFVHEVMSWLLQSIQLEHQPSVNIRVCFDVQKMSISARKAAVSL